LECTCTVEADEEEKKRMKKRIKELEKEVSELKRSRKWYESSRKGLATTGRWRYSCKS
jgi:50S ribosomal subunit-associated GTPase HflX